MCPVCSSIYIEDDFSASDISNTVLETTENGVTVTVPNCQGISFQEVILDYQSVGIVIDDFTVFPSAGLFLQVSELE